MRSAECLLISHMAVVRLKRILNNTQNSFDINNHLSSHTGEALEVLGESGFAPLVHAAMVGPDADTTISALTAIGNLLLAGKAQFKDEMAAAIEKENLFESLVEGSQEPGPLQDEVARV